MKFDTFNTNDTEDFPIDITFTGFTPCDILDLTYNFPTTSDIGDDKKVNLRFMGNHILCAYALYNGNDLKADKSILTRLKVFESPETAIAYLKTIETTSHSDLVRFQLNLNNGLDLLDLADLRRLKDFYNAGIKDKSIKKSITDSDLIRLYAKENNIHVVRCLAEPKDSRNKSIKLFSSSSISERFVFYRILNTDCVGDIDVWKAKVIV